VTALDDDDEADDEADDVESSVSSPDALVAFDADDVARAEVAACTVDGLSRIAMAPPSPRNDATLIAPAAHRARRARGGRRGRARSGREGVAAPARGAPAADATPRGVDRSGAVRSCSSM
jgi:hypothetical protein